MVCPEQEWEAPNLTQSVARIPFLRGFLEAPCRYNLPRYPYLSDISSHLLIRYRGALFFARTGDKRGTEIPSWQCYMGKVRVGKSRFLAAVGPQSITIDHSRGLKEGGGGGQEGGFQEFQD
jgi:hypothetical protein